MAGGRRNGRGGGKIGGKVIDTAGNTPLTSADHSPETSPLLLTQASPQAPLTTAVNDVLGEVAKISLQERLSALKDNELKDNKEGNETQQPQPTSSAGGSPNPVTMAPAATAEGCSKYVDEDECWDSDDEDDFDPTAVSLLASQVSFPLTLLIPIQWESEVPKLKPTVIAHLDHWKASLTVDAQTTTKYQEMLPLWLSKKRYGRLQVTFQHASDAASVWRRSIEHDVGKGVTLTLNWQHPENATYRKERQQNPDAVEVLLKYVPAGVSPELVRKMLTEVVLLKKGKPAFSKGVGFHRVQDPVTVSRFSHLCRSCLFLRNLLTSRLKPLLATASLKVIALTKDILKDPAIVLTSTGGSREDWVCVVAACDKAQGASFEQALAHVASLRHKTNLTKPGAATRASKGALNLGAFRKELAKFCELNINGLGSAGKQEKCKDWQRNKVDVAILTDTRIQADQNFWTQLKPSAVVAVGPAGPAGGVAVVSFVPGMSFTHTYTHASGRLVGVVVRWEDLELLLVALYSPAQLEIRAPFYKDCLGPFLGTLPKMMNVMVMGDMNVVEDPALDKSTGVGSSAENRRLMSYWANSPLTDAFRFMHPGKREYTFHMRAKGVSTRIDRALVSQSLLCKQVDVRHADITNKMTDHWSAVVVALESSAAVESGPGIWQLRAVRAKKRGVRSRVEKVIKDAGGNLGFVSWAEGLHIGAGTRLHINGWTGDRVAVERGVRQGCPLAPYLFLCAVEPLCQEIAQRRLGVGDEGAEKLAYLGYADDTSLLLQGEEQLAAAAEVLENFGKASGLKVNKDKTVVFPLGENRGEPPPADLQFKWADKAAPERLRTAYIYPPPEEIWTKIKRIYHHFVSEGEATEEKAFVLWNYELVCTPLEEGGLGMICPKKRFDSIAVQNVGRMMLQTNLVKKWLTEQAAAMPLGPDTIYAHQSLLRHWKEGSKRWKDMTQAFWKSPFCVTPEPSNRWEVEREQLAFNRRIPFGGASPFGNKKG
ncbi:unnamed protein product [Closterium sp. NIES-65]|nr:unnamed protein product [Closterium sp. NIES-65]